MFKKCNLRRHLKVVVQKLQYNCVSPDFRNSVILNLIKWQQQYFLPLNSNKLNDETKAGFKLHMKVNNTQQNRFMCQCSNNEKLVSSNNNRKNV